MAESDTRRVGGDLAARVHRVLAVACARLGLSPHDAELVRLHSNAVFRLPGEQLVVRIATNPRAWASVAASVQVTRWLAARGLPTVEPADVPGQPLLVDGMVVSLWHLVPLAPGVRGTASDLGHILRTLHDQPQPPVALPPLAHPLQEIERIVHEHAHVLAPSHRSWLRQRIGELREAWDALAFPRPQGLVHGDAHPGNLLPAVGGRVVLGDWDQVGLGPREWDLIQVHYTHRRFGRPAASDLDAIAACYGWDIRDWPGLDTLIAIRELSGLSPYIRTAPAKPAARREVTWRLETLMTGDTKARWQPPGN